MLCTLTWIWSNCLTWRVSCSFDAELIYLHAPRLLQYFKFQDNLTMFLGNAKLVWYNFLYFPYCELNSIVLKNVWQHVKTCPYWLSHHPTQFSCESPEDVAGGKSSVCHFCNKLLAIVAAKLIKGGLDEVYHPIDTD